MKRRHVMMTAFVLGAMLLFFPGQPVNAQAMIDGGVLSIPMSEDAHHLNPLTWSTIYEGNVIGHIYEPLVRYDVDYNPVPCLASSWSFNDSYTEYTFIISDNVTWHDGELFDAYDVNYTLNLVLGDPGIPRRSWVFPEIDTIEAISSTEIRVTLFNPVAPEWMLWDFATAYILPQHIWENVADIYTFSNLQPIGTGMFKFNEWKRGQYFLLDAYEDYWIEGKPYIDTKEIPIIREPESTFYALKSGEVHAMGTPPPGLIADAEADPNLEVHTFSGDDFGYIAQNQRRYPNDVKEFRQAVAYAINKTEIIEVARYGIGLEGPNSCNTPYGPFFEEDIMWYETDFAMANQILDDLGWDDSGDGVRETTNGTRLSFALKCIYNPQVLAQARLIQEYMELIGVEITIVPTDWGVLWGEMTSTYDYDWVYAGWYNFAQHIDPNWAYWLFSIDSYWGGTVNVPGWQNDTLDTLCDDIIGSIDINEQTVWLKEVQQIVAEEVPYHCILFFSPMSIYRTDLFDGWQMSQGFGVDNWQTWLNVHLIAPQFTPEPPGTYVYMSWSMAGVGVLVIVVAALGLRKK